MNLDDRSLARPDVSDGESRRRGEVAPTPECDRRHAQRGRSFHMGRAFARVAGPDGTKRCFVRSSTNVVSVVARSIGGVGSRSAAS